MPTIMVCKLVTTTAYIYIYIYTIIYVYLYSGYDCFIAEQCFGYKYVSKVCVCLCGRMFLSLGVSVCTGGFGYAAWVCVRSQAPHTQMEKFMCVWVCVLMSVGVANPCSDWFQKRNDWSHFQGTEMHVVVFLCQVTVCIKKQLACGFTVHEQTCKYLCKSLSSIHDLRHTEVRRLFGMHEVSCVFQLIYLCVLTCA